MSWKRPGYELGLIEGQYGWAESQRGKVRAVGHNVEVILALQQDFIEDLLSFDIKVYFSEDIILSPLFSSS